MKLKIEMDLDNAGLRLDDEPNFVDLQAAIDCLSIHVLDELGNLEPLDEHKAQTHSLWGYIRDVNGNKIGQWEIKNH